MKNIPPEAQQAMGLARYHVDASGIPSTERRMLESANEILGFT